MYMKIILASASPRRRELLSQMGLEFEVCPSQGEEKITEVLPEQAVMELAQQKAAEIAEKTEGDLWPENPWQTEGCKRRKTDAPHAAGQ